MISVRLHPDLEKLVFARVVRTGRTMPQELLSLADFGFTALFPLPPPDDRRSFDMLATRFVLTTDQGKVTKVEPPPRFLAKLKRLDVWREQTFCLYPKLARKMNSNQHRMGVSFRLAVTKGLELLEAEEKHDKREHFRAKCIRKFMKPYDAVKLPVANFSIAIEDDFTNVLGGKDVRTQGKRT